MVLFFNSCLVWPKLDKAPRLSISNVIWILSFDTICQLNPIFSKSEAAMLSSQSYTRHLAPVSVLLFGSCHLVLPLFVSSTSFIQIVRRQCCLVLAHLDVVVHLAFHQLLPILMFITLLIVDGKWNPKTDALVLLTIGTLSLFLLKFFMKQMDGALKQDCLGVNNKHHAAETWDLEFVFQTPQKQLFVKNHIICFPSLQPCWVGFKISLSLSRERAISRDEIEIY